jgi:hypothetical protein
MDNVHFQEREGGAAPEKTVEDITCECTRPNTNVHCNACGYVTAGRIRKPCPRHPTTIFLLDLAQCPWCRSYSFMMQEVAEEEKENKRASD